MADTSFRRVKYFLSAVDARTMTAAAQSLRMAQPALSRQIKLFEQDLGLTLFRPKGNRLVLTTAGERLVPMARRLMGEVDRFERGAATLSTGRASTLTVGTTEATLRNLLAPFIATLGSDDPLVNARTVIQANIPVALREGCDAAISTAPMQGELVSETLGAAPIYACVSARHPMALAGIVEAPIEDFADHAVVLPTHRNASRYLLDFALSAAGIRFPSVMESDDGQAIMALAASGTATGFTSELPRFGVHPIRVLVPTTRAPSGVIDGDAAREPLAIELHLVWPRGHYAHEQLLELAGRLSHFLDRWAAADWAGMDEPWNYA